MTFDQPHSRTHLSSTNELRIDAICDRFEAAWKDEQRPSIKEHINDWSDPELSSLLHELLVIDLAYRVKRGEAPSRAEYETIFPQHIQIIADAFAEVKTSPPGKRGSSTDLQQRPPDISPSDADGAQPTLLSDEVRPTQIDRYRILKLLGKGGFGTVYLGYDDQLRRKVAIKVPRMDRVAEPDSFLIEARIVASLDHPNIVNVYHAGQTSDGTFYIVSKWMEGADLSQVVKDQKLPYRECAELVAKIADALQYAHSRKLVHRDIKPANILIDSTGEPYLADFGLALSEDAFGREGAAGGTAAYMSPEQARGEGHLVDGRSDIFSLGAVFYRLLTGELPFKGSSPDEILERIRTQEPRPPRQSVEDVPKELERICLKALCRQAKDRYTTAFDMADDLQHFLHPNSTRTAEPAAEVIPTQQAQQLPAPAPKVVPKGLRAFDRVDADFFLQLLPGPVDRDGLPEAIRFWKTRIEERDADYTFRVGLIYGPSGCGKSSLIKAGLLPRLADHVENIYIECNGSDDEQRLLRGLRKRFDGLELGLSESLATIRRGQAMPDAHKILIVLDQFEQWLHAHRETGNARLIDALRQCDGERVQCIILARDDFWMAVTRFMRQLDEPILEGHNSAAVHLFDTLHARNVLTDFGRSFGRLPDESAELSSDQTKFLDQAISDLTREGEIIPVRLTLFADMVKGKAWTPSTLKHYGGTGGVTTTFLEESFSATSTPPGRRLHERAARAVLRALLPETGTNMKGYKRSHTQLLEASGYRERPQQFDDLMRILDNETRLLTPIEPALVTERILQPLQTETSERYYQLTHDYLVEPLREWLTRKQRETRRGRAELMLAERSSLWNSRPEKNQLPFGWEWLSILLMTDRKRWTTTQNKMMRAATNLHISALVMVFLIVAGSWAWKYRADEPIRHAVAEVRKDWQKGLVKDAVIELGKVQLNAPDHPAVQQLMSEMSNKGGATFDIEPKDLEVEVFSDPAAAEQPVRIRHVLEESRFRSGDHVQLTVGHYRVHVYRGSDKLAELPFNIDQIAHDVTTGERLRPHVGATEVTQGKDNSSQILLAEQAKVFIQIPVEIPKAFAYVNPGFGWHGPPPTSTSIAIRNENVQATTEGKRIDIETLDGSAYPLTREYLRDGFIIAKTETPVGDFRIWWNRFGGEFCEWRIDIYSRIAEAIAETKVVPLSVHRDCWRDELDTQNMTHDQILMSVFKDLHSPLKKHWETYSSTTSDRIKKTPKKDDPLPVTVGWETAIAYARTHDDIDPEMFERWVKKMVSDAEHYETELKNLRNEINSRNDNLVERDELPKQPLVRDLLNPIEVNEYPRRVREAYVYWLKIRTYYGWQVPIERVLAASKAAPSELEQTTWLWTKSKGPPIRDWDSLPRQLVDSYADAIMSGNEKPDRKHLLEWLGWMTNLEIAEGKKYSELLARLNDSADNTLETLPFTIRYRYGFHLGWDIPTWTEWERAYRGTDGRSYAWGNKRHPIQAWVDRGPGGKPLRVDKEDDPVRDTSPYGVLHMSGNVSEWVRGSGSPMEKLNDESNTMVPKWDAWSYSFPQRVYLKGGNYIMAGRFTHAGYTLSLPAGPRILSKGGVQTKWTGFRVIRRITEDVGQRGS